MNAVTSFRASPKGAKTAQKGNADDFDSHREDHLDQHQRSSSVLLLDRHPDMLINPLWNGPNPRARNLSKDLRPHGGAVFEFYSLQTVTSAPLTLTTCVCFNLNSADTRSP